MRYIFLLGIFIGLSLAQCQSYNFILENIVWDCEGCNVNNTISRSKTPEVCVNSFGDQFDPYDPYDIYDLVDNISWRCSGCATWHTIQCVSIPDVPDTLEMYSYLMIVLCGMIFLMKIFC